MVKSKFRPRWAPSLCHYFAISDDFSTHNSCVEYRSITVSWAEMEVCIDANKRMKIENEKEEKKKMEFKEPAPIVSAHRQMRGPRTCAVDNEI